MTNEEAILRLAWDTDDKAALMAIAENNLNTLKAAIKRYFGGGVRRRKALMTLLIRISRRTKYFIQWHDDADEWIEVCAEMECRRLRSEIEGIVAHAPRAYYYLRLRKIGRLKQNFDGARSGICLTRNQNSGYKSDQTHALRRNPGNCGANQGSLVEGFQRQL